MSDNLLKLIIGLEVIKMISPIPVEILFDRYYLGKYRVRLIERIANRSYVEFLEKGIIGNKKRGYREARIGEKVFLYTRNCYRERR